MSARPLVLLTVALGVLQPGCGAKSDVSTVTFETELSDVDRKAAMAQQICPVTEKRLFSMGTPIKVTSEGRHFFICCASCESDAEAGFAKYFAKTEIKPNGSDR
jgi:hypothetical protein